jgi:hypothetical protein
MHLVASDDIPTAIKLDATRTLNAALQDGWPGQHVAEYVALDKIDRAHERVVRGDRPGRVVVVMKGASADSSSFRMALSVASFRSPSVTEGCRMRNYDTAVLRPNISPRRRQLPPLRTPPIDTIADSGALQIHSSVRATDCPGFDTLQSYFIYEIFSGKINRASEIQRLNFLNNTIE